MENKLINKITNIYLIILIVIFPLLVSSKGYENILEVKYYSFIFIVVSYFLLSIIVYFYELIIRNNNILKGYKFTILDYLVLGYLLINIISTIFSPYKNLDLLKGLGRGEGLLIVFIYVLLYFLISLFGKFDKKIFNYFSISSLLVSLIGILQFFGFNPLNLYKGISGPYNMSYMSTIGNIDFLSAYYTITISMTSLCYIFKDNNKKEKMLYLLSLICNIFIFLIINVDSGKVAFLLLILVMLPYIIKNNIRLGRFLNILAIIILGYFINYFIDMRYIASINVYKACFHFNLISLILFITIIILLMASFFLSKKDYEIKKVNKFYLLYIPLIIIVLFIIYNYDLKISFLNDISKILHGNFDDTIGNNRLFLWKRSLILFKDYPILGTGPDTFGYRFMTNFKDDILLVSEMSINDTAANVYLTNLVNIGIIGFISYLLVLIDPFLKKNKSLNYKILLLVLLCFSVSNFFNISLVIITPYLWIILGLINIEKREIKCYD